MQFSTTMKKQIKRGLSPLLLILLCAGLVWTGCRIEIGEPDPPIPPTNTYPTTPPTELPPATQTGAGTLGCKINGRVWTFWIPPIALTPEQDAFVTESDGSGLTNIRARIWSADTFVDQKLVYHSIGFSFFNPNFEPFIMNKSIVEGTQSIDQFRFRLGIGNQSKVYYPDTSTLIQTNRVLVDRIDTDLNIISGRFEMTLYRYVDDTYFDKSDSLILTDGRFDFKYTPQ
jgi:hypothetical protein